MPGKLRLGISPVDIHAFEPNVAKAYCEGRTARRNGATVDTNPHGPGPGEAFFAWDNGWTDGLTSTELLRGGCAE